MTVSSVSLRQKRAQATREHILNEAFELLVRHPDLPFSHEAVAKAAGVGARTVYRCFPAQSDLYESLWLRVRERSGTVFPRAEDEIIPRLRELYRAFEANERLVRAVMESPAGARVRSHGVEEGRTCFDESLRNALRGRATAERRRIRAVFQALHSGPFWQMLRDRGGLSGRQAIAAASWVADALLDTLHRDERDSTSGSKRA
jgi:AcrR family transcriptional regulator